MRHLFGQRLGLLLLVGSLSGCSLFGGGVDKGEKEKATRVLQDDNSGTLKVLIVSPSADSFMRSYGSILLAKFPQLDMQFETVPLELPGKPLMGSPAYMDAVGDIIAKDKSDLIYSTQLTDTWVKRNLLLDLDTLIKQDKFDIGGLHPGAVIPIRRAGGGKLFALSPTLNASALMYNKDLFDRFQVPVPTDGMTWEQVIALAKKFPADGNGANRIYGYADSDASILIDRIARQGGLTATDPTGTKVMINSPAWKAIWHLVMDNASSFSFKRVSEMKPGMTFTETLKQDRFLSGQAAMTLASLNTFTNLPNYTTANGFKPFQWDLVTEPIDPRYPGQTTSYGPGNLFSIGAQAGNPNEAWKVIKYVTGEAFATISAKMGGFTFPARTSAVGKVDGHSLDAFFKLKVSDVDLAELHKHDPSGFSSQYYTAIRSSVQAIEEGESVDQRLGEMQADLQQQLDALSAGKPAQGGAGS